MKLRGRHGRGRRAGGGEGVVSVVAASGATAAARAHATASVLRGVACRGAHRRHRSASNVRRLLMSTSRRFSFRLIMSCTRSTYWGCAGARSVGDGCVQTHAGAAPGRQRTADATAATASALPRFRAAALPRVRASSPRGRAARPAHTQPAGAARTVLSRNSRKRRLCSARASVAASMAVAHCRVTCVRATASWPAKKRGVIPSREGV